MSAEQTIADFIKWCKGRYGFNEHDGCLFEASTNDYVNTDKVIKEYLAKHPEGTIDTQHSTKYAIEFNFGDGYWYIITFEDGEYYKEYQAEEDDYENVLDYVLEWLDADSNYYTYNVPDEEFDKVFPNCWDDIEKLEDKVIPELAAYLEEE